jgi:non-ribosomal peptide synthetase component F
LPFDIKETARNNNITIGVLLYTAWAITLVAWTLKPDVTFVITVSGRDVPIPGILAINGPTLMTVPIRVLINRDIPVTEVAQSLFNLFWDVSKHAHHGMRHIIRDTASSNYLCDTVVNFLINPPMPQAPRAKKGDSEIYLKDMELPIQNATNYLTLELNESNLSHLRLFSEHNFPDAASMLGDVVNILSVIVEDPQKTVAEILRIRNEARCT